MSDLPTTTEDFTPEQLKLITDTVAKGATPNELKLFLYRCRVMGLDPLRSGQIYFVKYGNNPGTVVVGLDGFRSRASKTGKLAGIKRGAIKDDKGKLIGAWAEVSRSDWKDTAREEVALAEYNTGKAMWAKMPETMLKKVAECAALRMAFPDELGGVYERAEMDQAEDASKNIGYGMREAIAEEPNLREDQGYRIPFGKYARRSLEEIDLGDLRSYVMYLEKKIEDSGKLADGNIRDFLDRATQHIAALENSVADSFEGTSQFKLD